MTPVDFLESAMYRDSMPHGKLGESTRIWMIFALCNRAYYVIQQQLRGRGLFHKQ